MTDIASSMLAPERPVETIWDADPLLLSPDLTCSEATKRFAGRSGFFHTSACVVDGNGHFLGIVSLRDCLNGSVDSPVEQVMTRKAPTVRRGEAEAERTSYDMIDRDIDLMPVLEKDGRVAGVVHAEKAKAFLVEELHEDADRWVGIAGGMKDDYFDHTVWTDFRRRVPWVLALAVAGLAAGYVVHIYEDALDALVILALYMPMVADTGGNVGTQSASLVTRALTTGDVKAREALWILWREMRVSLLMAGTLFLFAFLKVLLISNAADVPDTMTLEAIGLAIAIALAAQVISATLIGAVLPLAAIAVRQDPAVVSGPALTTIVDLTGLLLYFTITASMLGLAAP
ncbi:magnesium transporter [Martelella soudanensis]|uniref:magnesium transporter n=1 Tax=unclassified Martelella TaxID=2629616 RepID=UPI0015DD814F|nr:MULTISPECIES: magnesium transporter [unclassified Martelella]